MAYVSAAVAEVAVWDAQRLLNHGAPYVNLKMANTDTVKATISRDQILKIERIKQKIEDAAGDVKTKLYIADGDEPNAFASNGPPPIMAINIPMLKLLGSNDSMIAALIGHELAHVYARHKNMSKERNAGGIILGLLLGAAGVPLGGTVGSLITDAAITPFERDQEREADRLGMNYVIQAGYDPAGGVELFTALQNSSRGLNIPFLSTHPASQERIDNIRSMIASHSDISNKPPIDNSSVTDKNHHNPNNEYYRKGIYE